MLSETRCLRAAEQATHALSLLADLGLISCIRIYRCKSNDEHIGDEQRRRVGESVAQRRDRKMWLPLVVIKFSRSMIDDKTRSHCSLLFWLYLFSLPALPLH